MADISIIHEGNTDYNVKDAVGREALAVVENKGAKNILDNQHLVMSSATGVTITSNNDGTYNLSGTPTGTATYLYTTSANFSSLYGTEIGKSYTITAGSNKVLIRVDYSTDGTSWDNGEDGQPLVANIAGVATFTIPASTVGLYIRFRSTASAGSLDGIILKPMLCTKAEGDISDVFVPYAKTNSELTELEEENRSNIQQLSENYAEPIPKNVDLDDYTNGGIYSVANSTTAATILHSPASNYGYILEVFSISDNTKYQRIIIGSDIYTRRKQSSGWQSWYKFTGTVVT